MTTTTISLEEKYATRIAKLLTQAENTAATPAEAEAFMAKAAQLMIEYAIDEQMINAARGLTVDELVQDTFNYTGIYRNGHRKVAIVVGDYFGLKMVQGSDTGRSPIRLPLHLAGFRSDVERARLLDTSLQLQCVSAHNKWWAENNIVHSAETYGPYPHGDDRFAVRFVYDVTFKPTNTRRTLDEVAVFHVANGKVVREEFFYPTA